MSLPKLKVTRFPPFLKLQWHCFINFFMHFIVNGLNFDRVLVSLTLERKVSRFYMLQKFLTSLNYVIRSESRKRWPHYIAGDDVLFYSFVLTGIYVLFISLCVKSFLSSKRNILFFQTCNKYCWSPPVN